MKLMALFLSLSLSSTAMAFLAAPRLSPVSQMHGLPRIEEPGWSKEKEFKFDANLSNHWNAPANFRRSDTGQILRATIDFEETNYSVTFGAAMTDWLQVGTELSWVDRSGGHFDQSIDQFHLDARIYRFQRERYGSFQSRFMTETDGVEKGSTLTPSGLSNLVLRAKVWLMKWGDEKFQSGVSLLLRHKQSVDDGGKGLSSGSQDQTYSVLVGTPVGSSSALYFAITQAQIGGNLYFNDWPRQSNIQMFEFTYLWGFSDSFQIILNHGTESPYMDKGKLEFIPDANRELHAATDRSSSAFNQLTGWRGQQTLGVRFLLNEGSRFSVYMTEDWEYSDRDSTGDFISTTGAPDVSLGIQYETGI